MGDYHTDGQVSDRIEYQIRGTFPVCRLRENMFFIENFAVKTYPAVVE
jgi:hypothetical protein